MDSSRRTSPGSVPWAAACHCRSASMRLTTAVGVPQTYAASRTAASRSSWRGWSRTPYESSAATRASSSGARGQAGSARSAASRVGSTTRGAVMGASRGPPGHIGRSGPDPYPCGCQDRPVPAEDGTADVRALLTPEGAALVARLTPYDDRAALATAELLRREGVPPELAAAAMTQ